MRRARVVGRRLLGADHVDGRGAAAAVLEPRARGGRAVGACCAVAPSSEVVAWVLPVRGAVRARAIRGERFHSLPALT